MAEFVYGIHAVAALLGEEASSIEKLYVQAGRDDERIKNILRLAEGQHITLSRVDKRQLDEFAKGGAHQGVVAACGARKTAKVLTIEALIDSTHDKTLILILDQVQDPHNLGACARSAEALGVDAIIIPTRQSAGITDIVKKVSCGATERIPIIQVSNLARAIDQLKKAGIWVVGTSLKAPIMPFEMDMNMPIALAMGAEATGLRRLTEEKCDYLIKIPQLGQTESLNVSVATGICLYEVVRQRIQADK